MWNFTHTNCRINNKIANPLPPKMKIRNPICLSIAVPIIVATTQISPNLIQLSNPAIVPNSILFTSQSKEGAVDYKFTASEKNYTTKTNENEISTHEALSSHSCFLINQKVGKHRLKGKLIHFVQSPLEINNFPKFAFSELL